MTSSKYEVVEPSQEPSGLQTDLTFGLGKNQHAILGSTTSEQIVTTTYSQQVNGSSEITTTGQDTLIQKAIDSTELVHEPVTTQVMTHQEGQAMAVDKEDRNRLLANSSSGALSRKGTVIVKKVANNIDDEQVELGSFGDDDENAEVIINTGENEDEFQNTIAKPQVTSYETANSEPNDVQTAAMMERDADSQDEGIPTERSEDDKNDIQKVASVVQPQIDLGQPGSGQDQLEGGEEEDNEGNLGGS